MTPEIFVKQLKLKLQNEIACSNNSQRRSKKQKLSNIEAIEKYLKNPDCLYNKHLKSVKKCMAFNKNFCKGNIIKAHGNSKKSLKNIANNGHVLTLNGSFHHKPTGMALRFVGINDAGIFTGFCEFHDNHLFKSFEDNNFNGSYKQIYDCTFKALSKEFFELKDQLYDYPNFLDPELKNLFGTDYTSSKKYVAQFEKHIASCESLYNEYYKLEQSGLLHVVLETSKLPIATSGVFFPGSLKGKLIQTDEARDHGMIYYTITEENTSYIILAATKSSSNVGKNILEQFNNAKIDSLNYLLSILIQINNLYLDPVWYDKLNNDFKKNFLSLICLQPQQSYEFTILDNISQHMNINSFKVKAHNL